MKLWDTNQQMSTQTIPAHDFEVLSCDWNKYNPNLLVTASVDKTIKCWDIRNPSMELTILHGHTYAVRRVRCSPHQQGVIASCSYDMTMRMWDMESPNSQLQCFEHHTEFTVGCDFNSAKNTPVPVSLDSALVEVPQMCATDTDVCVAVLAVFNQGQVASCAWDETVHVWNQGEYPQPAMGF